MVFLVRVLAASSASLLFFACASTARHFEANPAESPTSETEPPQSDRITERWPELARVEERIEAGALDDARAVLVGWSEPGLESRCEGLDDEQRVALARRVDGLAKPLALLEIQLAARTMLHDLLERTLAADHQERLGAKTNLAVTRYQLGDLRGALALQEQVHAAHERLLPRDHPDLLHALQNLVLTRKALGDLQGAHALEEDLHAARERTMPADHPDLLALKLNLGVTRHALGDVAGAHALFEHVHAAWERLLPQDHPRLLLAKQNLAGTRRELGDVEGARALFEYVHSARERQLPPDHPDLLATKHLFAETLMDLGDRVGAHALCVQVHAVRERLQPTDHPELLYAKHRLAATSLVIGDLDGARALREDVLAAYERILPPDHSDLLGAKMNLASVLKALGDFQGALALEEHVHAAWERLLPENHEDLLSAKMNLAITRNEVGDLEGAYALFECVHAKWELLLPEDNANLLLAKSNLAAMRMAIGDVQGAHPLFEHVHAARERTLSADHPDLLQAKLNLAVTCRALGDLHGAHALFEQVHAAWERNLPSDHADLLRAKQNLAVTCKQLGDVARALELEEQVHEARERLLPADHPDLLRVKQNLAVTHLSLGDVEGALELIEQVHEARERLLPADHRERQLTNESLAMMHSVLGDLGAMRTATDALLNGQLAVAASMSTQAPRLARSAMLYELAMLETCAFLSEALEAADGVGMSPRLFATLESLRAVSTVSYAIARAAAEVPQLDATRIALAHVRRDLADASLVAPMEAAAMGAWRTRLHDLADRRDGLEHELRRQLEDHGFELPSTTLASIAAGIEEGGAFVGFWRYDRWVESAPGTHEYQSTDSLVAFVLTRDGAVSRVELGSAEQLETLTRHWRSSLGAAIESRGLGTIAAPGIEEHALGNALRAALLEPIFAALGGVVPHVLNVVPDDFVYLVPLDALPNEDGTRVGERVTVRIDPSVARLVRSQRMVDSIGTLVAFGGVDYDATASSDTRPSVDADVVRAINSNFEALAETQPEALGVARLFEEHVGGEARRHLGADASEAALVEIAPQARYLHIATHGWFTQEAEALSMADRLDGLESTNAIALTVQRAQDTIVGFMPETLCGLALAGANHGTTGRLTAEELATLDLSNCELAVLSACETNVGIRRAGQGIQSLQTALHAAGARTAITSLWRVDDAATRHLFELFYTKLWSEKLGPADALWQAKMALRSEGHPTRDWAGWVLTGDPD